MQEKRAPTPQALTGTRTNLHTQPHIGNSEACRPPSQRAPSLDEGQGQAAWQLPPVSIYATGWQRLGQELKGYRLDSYLPDLRWPWRQGSSEAWSGSQTDRGMDRMTLAETLSLESQRQQIQGVPGGGLWGLLGPPCPTLQVGACVSGSVGSGSACLCV